MGRVGRCDRLSPRASRRDAIAIGDLITDVKRHFLADRHAGAYLDNISLVAGDRHVVKGDFSLFIHDGNLRTR